MGVRKGCYNCSKRRILCDETQPQCQKCVKKGLLCSGQGLRIRFNDGVASRGKLRGLAIPVLPEKLSETAIEGNESCSFNNDLPPGSSEQIDTSDLLLPPHPRPSNPWEEAELLLHHFSTAIAPNMVILDGEHNGYRKYILPLARTDPLVQKAVFSIAGFDLWRNNPQMRAKADLKRTQVIRELKSASLTSTSNEVLTTSSWATLLTLLLGELILGSDHYIFLLRMMCVIKDSNVSDGHDALLEFLRLQTDMLTLLAQPFIDSASGIPLVDAGRIFERLRTALSMTSDAHQLHERTVDIIIETSRTCFEIYYDRKQGNTASNTSTLEYIRSLLQDIQPGAPGSHALVWHCFIAAADSDVQDQRDFFVDRLSDIYHSTNCANISEGFKMLEKLWARPPQQTWTEILPIISTTFVM